MRGNTNIQSRRSASTLHAQQFRDPFLQPQIYGLFLSPNKAPSTHQQSTPAPNQHTTQPAASAPAPFLEVPIQSTSRFSPPPPLREAADYSLAFCFLPQGYSMLPPGAVLPTLNGQLGRASQKPAPAPPAQSQRSPRDTGYVYPSLAHVPLHGGVQFTSVWRMCRRMAG
jgi:hypothetical protein